MLQLPDMESQVVHDPRGALGREHLLPNLCAWGAASPKAGGSPIPLLSLSLSVGLSSFSSFPNLKFP